jgi:CRISPR-associated protein Csd1
VFIQALAEYADRTLAHQLDDVAFEERRVPYLIEIDERGGFLNTAERMVVDTAAGKKAALPRPDWLLVPRSPVNRNAGLHPLLAVDDIKYVLGPGAWTNAAERTNHEERFAAFVALTRRAASETRDAALAACGSFYTNPAAVEEARHRLSGAKAGSLVALSVNGPVILRGAVREYWRLHYKQAAWARTAEGRPRECLISGQLGPVEPTHPKVKHTVGLGGHASGVTLMSFDKEAFRSYGWDQCANGPVSTDRAMAYVLALNDLLKPHSRHRHDMGEVAFISWTRSAEEFDPFTLLIQPNPEQLQNLDNVSRAADPVSAQFYMAALSANGSRLILRSWLTERVPDVMDNLRQWFLDLQGQPDAPSLWQVLYALDREGKPPASQKVALLLRALGGRTKQPLGFQMLSAIISRIRMDRSKRLNAAALGLVRLCINDVAYTLKQDGDVRMTASLDESNKNPAYLCGRLLAVHDSLQYAAFSAVGVSKINVTVGDRYYHLASTSPQVAFPKIVELGRRHLQKLRRVKGGLACAIEADIAVLQQEIEEGSGFAYPAALGLDGQGRFALGYYHQRAKQFQSKTVNNDWIDTVRSEERKER